MNCAVHPETQATGYCRNCGKALCAPCTRDVRGILYCESCLADMLARPQPAAGGGSPGLAAALGFIPGAGAAYNGEYTKAVIHLAIFVAFVGALNSDLGDPLQPMLGVSLAAFIFYMALDSYRTARAKLLGQPLPAPLGNIRTDVPIGPIILIALGVFFLLSKFLHLGHVVREFWPVIFIALGVLLLWKRMGRTS